MAIYFALRSYYIKYNYINMKLIAIGTINSVSFTHPNTGEVIYLSIPYRISETGVMELYDEDKSEWITFKQIKI